MCLIGKIGEPSSINLELIWRNDIIIIELALKNGVETKEGDNGIYEQKGTRVKP